MKKRRSFWEDSEENFEDVTVDAVDTEETEEEETEEEDDYGTEEAEYGAVEQTFQTSDILGTTVILDEEVSELAAKLGEEAEIDAEALSALVDDNAGAEMTAQFGKPFVSAPTEDGYETELLEEGQDSELYNRDADPFEDEADCEECEETDEIILDEEDEELDEEEDDEDDEEGLE